MGIIELKDVWKEFTLEKEKETTLKERVVNWYKIRKEEKILALKEINLTVKEGECFGILGKNGSGKTTLLKIIAGMLKPTKGTVEVKGKIIPILSLGLGFRRELTARENVYLYASILGLKKKEIEEKYEEIVKFSELEKVMDVKLKNLSDGMVMRLSFSIAFHVDADIILIDEVLAVGDASFQTKCLEKIRELKKEGKTILLVSQSPAEIRRFCDRALILDNGKIVLCGEASEICEKYEEMVESERLKRYNEVVMKENGIEFNAFHEVNYVVKTGEKCRIEIKGIQSPALVELFFNGKSKASAFSKNFDNDKIIFQTDSLPLKEGEYEVWIKKDGKILSKKPFKILVKSSKESEENKVYMLTSSTMPFQELTLVFGEKPEIEVEKFEKGKTVFSFVNLEEAIGKKVCFFQESKILFSCEENFDMEKLKEKIWYILATKYFKDILINTQLGKILMGSV